MKLLGIWCFALLLTVWSIPAFSQVVSDFNANDEGWTVADPTDLNPQTVIYNATGGNPNTGGCVSFSTTYSGALYWRAPAKFLGGHCLNSFGLNLKFDLQISAAGSITTTFLSYGSLRLTGLSGAVIVMDIIPDPLVTPGWTSYSIKLDETSPWKNSNITGTPSTHADVINVLTNLTKLEIVGQARLATDPEVRLDNVILEQSILGVPPTITSFAPQTGIGALTSITINGTNFNTTPSGNAVYFGGVLASVLTASATQLSVRVPSGANYAPIVVVDKSTGLSASSITPFQPRFDNNKDYGGRIIQASLSPAAMIPAASYQGWNEAADIDGDGLNDLVVSESPNKQFSVLRNIGSIGNITAASFASPVSFSVGVANSKGYLAIADYDGDGKLDVAVSSASAVASVSVFHNTSTPGSISFGAPLIIQGFYYSDGPLTAADIDGDGRPEILSVFNNSCGTNVMYIFPNRSVPGNIDFCAYISFPVYSCGGNITVGDLDGDKKPDVVTDAGQVHVFRNTSTPGSITMAPEFQLAANAGGRPVIADLDNDGKNDIGWQNNTTKIELHKNIYSGGAFDATAFSAPILVEATINNTADLIAGDINGDGKIDLVSGGHVDFSILQNVGTGALTSASFLAGVPIRGDNYNFVSPRLADFDGDNKLDFFMRVASFTVPVADWFVYVYHNESYPVPRLDTYSPSSGSVGSAITLTGDYMNTGSAQPLAKLEGIAATSNTSGNTSTSVTVPVGAKSGRFSLSEHGLTGFSKPFPLVFNTSRTIDATTFSTSIDFALNINTRNAIDVADFDDDGKQDVCAIDNNNTVKIFQNTATPGAPITNTSLTQIAATFSGGYDLLPLDIDGDGKIDLNTGYGLVENNSTVGSISFLGGPSGAYTYSGGFVDVAAADFNKDGKIDLATTGGGISLGLYENQSSTQPFANNGNFSTFNISVVSFPMPGNTLGVVAADFDGDGYDDLAATSSTTNNFSVFRNLAVYGQISSASFSAGSTVATGTQPYDLSSADFDGDGKPDIAVTHFNAASLFVSIYRNISTVGSIAFAAPLNLTCVKSGFKIEAQDLDGDGKPELVVIHQPNPGPGSFSVFQNTSSTGTLAFNPAVNYPISRNPQALAISDINIDKKPDILIVASPYATGGTAIMVFENKVADPVNTITITLQPVDQSVCSGNTATFSTDASGTTNLVFQWQFAASSAGPFSDIANGGGYSGATTKILSVNTAGDFGQGRYRAKISGDFAPTVFTNDHGLSFTTGCNNQPPVIAPPTETTSIGGSVSIDLAAAISDPDDNLDLNTLSIVQQPSSGAVATLDINHLLHIDYQGLAFSGIDGMTISVCDLSGACSEQDIEIEVVGDVIVFNAVSPNGDGKNEGFVLEFIDAIPELRSNKVSIYNRWGDEVFTINDYNNTSRIFSGSTSDGKVLPSGTYFYKVVFSSGAKTLVGYLELNR